MSKVTKVLIVEDDEQLSNLLQEFMIEMGLNSYIVNNCNEGLKRLSELEFNIVITDFNMPEMNGFEFIKNIKNNPNFDNIKIILMTGVFHEDLSKTLALCDGHIFKPFDIKHLESLINSFSINSLDGN